MSTQLPFYHPLDPVSPKIWPDYTLLMPVCAVGNIGQLACDLILATLLSRKQCQMVGRIYSPALMSVVGPNAFKLNGLPTTSTEVYESKEHKLVIIQQRTSYFKSLKSLYINDLVKWIKDARFEKIIILTSSFAQCYPDTSHLAEIHSGSSLNIRSIMTKAFETRYVDDQWKSIKIKPLADRLSFKAVRDGLSYLPGSGLTKALLKEFEKSFIPAAFIVSFCSEGINILDCYQVANMIDKLVKLNCNTTTTTDGEEAKIGDDIVGMRGQWVEPYSWAQ